MLRKLERKIYFKKCHALHRGKRCWVSAEGDVTPIKIARRTQSAKMFYVLMATIFGGMFYFKIMREGVSITSNEYTNFFTETINKFNSFNLPPERRSIPW